MQVVVKTNAEVTTDKNGRKQVLARDWWLHVPRSLSEAQFAVLARRGSRDPDKDTDELLAYYIGPHSGGAISTMWQCFEELNAL